MEKYSVKKDMGRPISIMKGDEKILDLSDDSRINGVQAQMVVESLNAVQGAVEATTKSILVPQEVGKHAHVIMMNDAVMAVNLGTEKEAVTEMGKLHMKHKGKWQNCGRVGGYEDIHHWHMRTVPIRESD